MNFDATTIGIWGLVLAALGILATVVAPRIAGAARLSFDISSISELRRYQEIGEIRIAVTHNNVEVPGPVYLVSASIANCGSKDVTFQDFIDPIPLSTSENFEILSVEAASLTGAGEAVSLEDGIGRLNWRILKPREKVYLGLVLLSKDGSSPSVKNKDVKAQIRLKDVLNGSSVIEKIKLNRVFGVFALLLGVALIIFYIPTTSPSTVFYENDTKSRIKVTPFGIYECSLQNADFYINDCSAISPASATSKLKAAKFEQVKPGISFAALLFIFITSMLVSIFLVVISPLIDRWRYSQT